MSFLSSVVASVPLDLDFLSFVTDINNGIVSQQEVKKLSFLSGCRGGSPCKVKPPLSKLCLRPTAKQSPTFRWITSFYLSLLGLVTVSFPVLSYRKERSDGIASLRASQGSETTAWSVSHYKYQPQLCRQAATLRCIKPYLSLVIDINNLIAIFIFPQLCR